MMDVEGGKEALERELNQTRDRLRAAQAASGDWLAEQNTQLRTITQLQAVQAMPSHQYSASKLSSQAAPVRANRTRAHLQLHAQFSPPARGQT